MGGSATLAQTIQPHSKTIYLQEYCDLYNVDANKISCEYFSFNTKNKAGTAPTLENLAQFETEKLKHLRGPRRPLDPIGNIEYDLLP